MFCRGNHHICKRSWNAFLRKLTSCSRNTVSVLKKLDKKSINIYVSASSIFWQTYILQDVQFTTLTPNKLIIREMRRVLLNSERKYRFLKRRVLILGPGRTATRTDLNGCFNLHFIYNTYGRHERTKNLHNHGAWSLFTYLIVERVWRLPCPASVPTEPNWSVSHRC